MTMMNVALVPTEPPDVEGVEEESSLLVRQAESMDIASDEDYEIACQFLREAVKAVAKKIHDAFDPSIAKAHDVHKTLLAERRKHLGPVEKAESVVKGKIATWHREQEAIRRKEEAEARRKAQEQAEQEALERAAQLEREGRGEEAEALIEQPIEAVAPTTPNRKPKAEGISVRKVWKFRVVDVSKVRPEYLVVDEKKVGQVVRALGKDAASSVGGIEVYQEDVVAART